MIVFKVALVDTFSDTEIAVGEKKKNIWYVRTVLYPIDVLIF